MERKQRYYVVFAKVDKQPLGYTLSKTRDGAIEKLLQYCSGASTWEEAKTKFKYDITTLEGVFKWDR